MSVAEAGRAQARGGIDAGQLLAMTELLVKQALRAGRDASTGARLSPGLQMPIVMGVLGLLNAGVVARCLDLGSFLTLLFASVFLVTVLAIGMEPQEALERNHEVFGPLPVSARTASAARLLVLAVLSTLIAAPLAAIPLWAAATRFAAPPWLIGATFVSLLVGTWSACALWVHVQMLALRWVTPEAMRKVTSTLLVLVMMMNAAYSTLGIGGLVVRWHYPIVEVLPSTWFATFLVGGSRYAWLQRGGAIAVFLLALGAFASGVRERSMAMMAERAMQASAGALGVPLSARLLRAFGASRLASSRPELSSAMLIASDLVTAVHRDPFARQRSTLYRAFVIVALAATVAGVFPAEIVTGLLGVLSALAAMEGASLMVQSATPGAGWVFFVARSAPSTLVAAMQWAILARFVALPLGVLGYLLVTQGLPVVACVVVPAYVAAARLVVALTLSSRGPMPWSREARVSIAGDLARGLIGSVAIQVVLGWMIDLLADGGARGFAIAAGAVMVVTGAALACERRAARSVAQAEFAH